MMQERDFAFNWDLKSTKRSSGLFSVLKWFGNKETVTPPPPPPPDLVNSTSSSCDSIESVFSTDTVASFAFVPPNSYHPFGAAQPPEKFIFSGPETSTYRARLAQRDARRETDRNLTLRSKYNLYRGSELADRVHSLPLMTKTATLEQGMHRRTASESSKHRRAGAYCHVKGKRKAPQPPGFKNDGTLRRKKRMAPQPPRTPDVIANDSLKLDRGILKPAKEQGETTKSVQVQEMTHVTPRPWYKRTLSKSVNVEKKCENEKRKSGLSFLTNISELDREAMEIVGKENLKMKYLKNAAQAPPFMRPRNTEHNRTNSDSWLSPKRKSAKDLIAKFNALTGVSKVSASASSKEIKDTTPPIKEIKREFTVNLVQVAPSTSKTPVEKKESLPSSPVPRTTAVVKPISRSQWNCPKCTLENDYWRIICRVCSTIKPYFDDFTSPTSNSSSDNRQTDQNRPDKKDTSDLLGLVSNEIKVAELQKSVFQSQYPKLSLTIDTKVDKNETTKVSETKNIFQGQYPKITLNSEFKFVTDRKSINEPVENGVALKPSEAKSIFQPQYPKINLNINKETAFVGEALTTKNEQTKPDNKTRFSMFDFNLDKNEKLIQDSSQVQTFDDISVAMKTEKSQVNKFDKNKIEKIILGDEISFETTKNFIREKLKESEKLDMKNKNPENVNKIEKMILGDEISVQKPDYTNKNDKTETDKNKNNEIMQKIEKIILGDEISVKKIEQQPKIEKSELTKSSEVNKKIESGAISKVKLKQSDEDKQNSAKKEEREKLKKMLIEMKNSLPKRTTKISNENKQRVSLIQEQPESEIDAIESSPEVKTAELIIATTETVYENIKIRRTDAQKPLKVSTSVQTNAILRRNISPGEAIAVKNATVPYQLIGAKDFVGISNEKTNGDYSHTYANLNASETKLPDIFAGCSKTDTLEINRLLRRLENAISGGELGQAAIFARELAQLKVPLSVIRQKAEDDADKKKQIFNVDMYVEDKISHRGPFPLKVTATMTVAELKTLVEEKYKIPIGVQRWILGKQLATNDNATLADHQISTSDCPVFLYLVAPTNDTKLEPNALEIIEVNDLDATETLLPTIDNGPIVVTDDVQTEPDIDDQLDDNIQDLWKCQACTLLNPLVTKVCEVCGTVREEFKQNENQTYLQLVHLDNEDLVRNVEAFECLICLTECPIGEGVTLRECLHQFCRTCLANTVEFSEEAEVKCPYRDQEYACDLALQDREVKALVTPTVYEQHLAKSVKQAENKMDNTFHCKTPDCKGWCIYEDNVNEFYCPVCRKNNCLTCQAIHTGKNCKQYQEQMKSQSETDQDARRTRDFLEDMIKRGEALACPTCQVVLLKKWGCDWLRCSMCKTEICWVTRGPRWGAAGKGDTSGGCKCGVNGSKCHPKCNYCH